MVFQKVLLLYLQRLQLPARLQCVQLGLRKILLLDLPKVLLPYLQRDLLSLLPGYALGVIGLLGFVLVTGSTIFLLQAFVQNTGAYLGQVVERTSTATFETVTDVVLTFTQGHLEVGGDLNTDNPGRIRVRGNFKTLAIS